MSMTLFWVGVVFLILLAFGFAVMPLLWRRGDQVSASHVEQRALNIDIFNEHLEALDQARREARISEAEYAKLRVEQERALLQDVDSMHPSAPLKRLSPGRAGLPLALALAIPLLAVSLYTNLGSSDTLARMNLDGEGALPAGHPAVQDEAQLLAAVEASLRQQPDNPQGLFLLGHSYLTTGRYQAAADAFDRLMSLVGVQAELLGPKAQALYFLNERQMTAPIQALVDQSLQLDPVDAATLGLVGLSYFDRQDYENAIASWQKVLDANRPKVNRQWYQEVIALARHEQSVSQGLAVRDGASSSGAAAAQIAEEAPDRQAAVAARLILQVDIDPAVKNLAASEDTVFVLARAWQGPRMPLAVQRMTVADLPRMVVLDDSMAMGPMGKLSSVEKVEVVAMVSKAGTPGVKPGDLEGRLGPLLPASRLDQVIELSIDRQVR
jgi:cytochrome c-type biogenesis protein CcmH